MWTRRTPKRFPLKVPHTNTELDKTGFWWFTSGIRCEQRLKTLKFCFPICLSVCVCSYVGRLLCMTLWLGCCEVSQGQQSIWPTVHQSYWRYWRCEMSPVTSFPCSFYLEAWAEPSEQQSPSVCRDSLLGGRMAAVQSPAGQWRHLAWLTWTVLLSCATTTTNAHTNTHTHTQRDSVNQSSFTQTAKAAVFLLPWAEREPPLNTPAPTQTLSFAVMCAEGVASIMMEDTEELDWCGVRGSLLVAKLCSTTASSQTLFSSSVYAALSMIHTWKPAPLCNVPPSLSHPQEILFSTLSHKNSSWARYERASVTLNTRGVSQFIYLCHPGFMSNMRQMQSN